MKNLWCIMSYFLIFPQIWAKIDHNMCEKILDQVQLAIKSHNSDIETLKVQMKSLQEENIELKGEVISLKIDIITLKVDKSEKVSCFCIIISISYQKFYL